jgi:hypothetical protein
MIGKGLDDQGIMVRIPFESSQIPRLALRYIQITIKRAMGLLSSGVKRPGMKITSYPYLELKYGAISHSPIRFHGTVIKYAQVQLQLLLLLLLIIIIIIIYDVGIVKSKS